MTEHQSPHPVERWYSAGHMDELWGDGGTYMEVPPEVLPAFPPDSLDGTFRWLVEPAPGVDGMQYGQDDPESTDDVAVVLEARIAEARRAGLTVPASFVTFMSNPRLFHRVPSCTACYFELGEQLVPVPGRDGPERLLRFMNDQQCCLLWYLLLLPDGEHRVACAAPQWGEEYKAGTLDDVVVPVDLAVCASSFEEFIRRFWIENTLWYAVHHRRPPIDGELRDYLEAARDGLHRTARR